MAQNGLSLEVDMRKFKKDLREVIAMVRVLDRALDVATGKARALKIETQDFRPPQTKRAPKRPPRRR